MLAGRRCCRSLLGGGYRDHPNIKESINGAFFFLLLLSRCVVEKNRSEMFNPNETDRKWEQH